ncbi:MAG: hypothetical protein CRU78_12555 [Candidatus Accumulibacter phosphatis]|uniref:DUF2934 domain-containing protein n=1 Tax=Candidatus Accumulibacter phosphatis TaxID=327160 RepID=A0A6A7RUN7_9PROT|nr:hypothetical protein [Candidatus Accumulibacter phosphatis]
MAAAPIPAATPVAEKPSAEERYCMIQSAAYFIAENDGFQGSSAQYWIDAEREVAARLGEL